MLSENTDVPAEKNILKEQSSSLPPIDLSSINEPISPSEPAPSDFEDRVAAAFADHSEELGYRGIPDSEWRLEASRLKDAYDKGDLSVESLDDLLGRIEIDYFDEYIEDVAEMYGVDKDRADPTDASLEESGAINERDITKAFLTQILS
tara:strand:- start:1459 stop:1905 length:447 start_codon:yes stop_codon:yes gene_type:complete